MHAENPQKPTTAEYVERWLELRKGDLASNTYARYRTLARNQVVPYIGSVPLAELGPRCLEWLYQQLAIDGGANGNPLRSATIGQVHRFLHVCLERAATDGILDNNPVDRVKSPRIAPRRNR
ncbi:MAG: hypothetical protein JO029_09150 [Candidatus Eremiobacteraeota bacterium]|nr:hypothetical protein [Candidatus Eremiobacteraeota bacterium]